MSARWISKEEYDALTDEEDTLGESPAGVQVLHTISGRVLESKAGPQSLEQRDYQGHAITHDILVHEGLHEEEKSNKTTHYAAGVNSTLTEVAPQICKRYTQDEHYTETYQRKTENIQAETYIRKTASDQHIKSQDTLNLFVPKQLQVEATDNIERRLGTRNATINHHQLTAGESIHMRYGTLTRYDDVTVIRAKHVRLCANHLNVNGGGGEAKKPLQPRRKEPSELAAKMSGTFYSKTIKLPPAYNNTYFIQVEFTVSGKATIASTNSINTTTLTEHGLETAMYKVLGDRFYGMETQEVNGLNEAEAGAVPKVVIGNKYGDITLTNGYALPQFSGVKNVYIFKYSSELEFEKQSCDDWLLSSSSTIEATVTISKRNLFDHTEIIANNLLDKIIQYYQQHKNDPHLGYVLKGLRYDTRPIVDSLYNKIDFLEEFAAEYYELIPVEMI